ncbi:hypothetical protein HY523_02895, partial [Candidatus Berkelbacteria bacterium]|nr:hypothetical protein [Candidatus Berkelbacteria bacterium]
MLHHHVKPHHHLTIWVVTALQVIFALVVYTDASVLAAREASDRETEPSQETQEFFGGKVKKETGSLPAECQRADARPAPLNTDTFPPESSRATSSSQPKVWDTFERVKPSESPISAQTSGNDYSSSAYPSSSPYPSEYPTSYSPSES